MMSRMSGMRSVRIETNRVGMRDPSVRAVVGCVLRYVSSDGMMAARLAIWEATRARRELRANDPAQEMAEAHSPRSERRRR